jgi:hypothetical protein
MAERTERVDVVELGGDDQRIPCGSAFDNSRLDQMDERVIGVRERDLAAAPLRSVNRPLNQSPLRGFTRLDGNLKWGLGLMKKKSKEWRDRAEQYRRLAQEATLDDMRHTYREVAQTCEVIGACLGHLEERHANSRTISATRR